MTNRPKAKGTGGETELVNIAAQLGYVARRTSPGANYDVHLFPARFTRLDPVKALATRPDRGQWLVSIPLDDFLRMLDAPAEVEVKRYKRFAHHTIFEAKHGGGA
jgi:hypothetical protein